MLGKEESYRALEHEVDLEGLTPLGVLKEEEPKEMAMMKPVPVPAPTSELSQTEKIDLGLGGNKIIAPVEVSWFQQLKWLLFKNRLLIARRPMILFLMIFSSVFSVLLSWPAGRDAEGTYPSEVDQCGVVPVMNIRKNVDYTYSYTDSDETFLLSLNDSWRSGAPVALLSIGPFIQAVCAFLIVHAEVEKKLVGVIRGLGVRESMFWMSWYLPFAASSLVNSLFGAITARFVPVHIFQNVYFGGIFGSLFFLQLALVSASFLLASFCGSNNRAVIYIIMLMGVAIWVPCIITLQSHSWIGVREVYLGENTSKYSGLLWTNRNTTRLAQPIPSYRGSYNDDFNQAIEPINNATCNNPIMNEEEGTNYKTEEERLQVTPDAYFTGCFFQPGYTSALFNPAPGELPLFISVLFPYFHFTAIYSNFLGYTGVPGKEFGPFQSNQPPEDLAIATLRTPPDESSGNSTSLFPQGSTLRNIEYYDEDAWDKFLCEHGEPTWRGCVSDESPDVCPASSNVTGFELCSSMYGSCNYVKDNKALSGSPSVHDLFGYLFFLSILYTILASYWQQVFPAGNGAPRKFYFFLSFRYWWSGKKNVAVKDGAQTVSINNVSKSFGTCKAVNEMSLELKRGEVTALLGHNGAGKSTLTNILSCEVVPTHGEVSIFGESVGQDPHAIRRLVGICKQDDFLWPNLTAKEHLDIFAGLRGVNPDHHDITVEKWLESVDLVIQRDVFSSDFSGGMKRRLSVALSTIGDRPFLIFDEPTTGMDPVNRRYVWQHLDEIKDGRVVLLTTHAMEEADLLADEVAIMKKGELVALGSPLELKSAHGSALQFSILVDKENTKTTEEAIIMMFLENLDYVTVTSGDAGNITVKIHEIQSEEAHHEGNKGVKVSSLSEFVGWLESDSSNVCEYGFSNSSLEEVFMAITREGIEDGANGSDVAQSLESEQTPSAEHEETLELARNISTFQPRLSVLNQTWALVHLSFQRKWRGRRSIFEYFLYGCFTVATFLAGLYSTAADGEYILGFLPLINILPIAGMSLMLISVTLPIYRDESEGLLHLMRTQGLRQTSYIGGVSSFVFLNQLLFGLVIFSVFYATPLFRETKRCDQFTFPDRYYGYGYGNDDLNNTLLDEDDEFLCSKKWELGSAFHSSATLTEMTNGDSLKTVRTPGGYLQMLAIPFLFALSMPGAALASSIIPGNFKFAMTIIGLVATIAFTLPLVFTYLWMYYSLYSDYVNYTDDDTSISTVEKCMRLVDPDNLCSDGISEDMQPEQALNCIGLQHDMSGLLFAHFCAPSYASMLPQFGTHQLLTATIMSDIKFWPESMSIFLEMFPNADCSGHTCKFPYAQKVYNENAQFFFLGAILLNVIGLILFILVWFPPSHVSKIKGCFTSFCRCTRGNNEHDSKESLEDIPREEVVIERNRILDIVRPFVQSVDIDEIEAGEHNELNVDYLAKNECKHIPPILMHKLRKVYPASGRTPPKVAVHSLDLHVKKGQVCGLLGKNGSGKTTALKILSNNHKASAGLALVSGYDVDTEKIKALASLGNCPQFDKVWDFLSVREHLEFFARLKGLPQVKEASKAIAKAVGLGASEVYNRAAKHLSGGMRRRLSIAISFVGAPGVLLLDEPTTGLDPSTRNEIWGLISAFATEERAMIITTHMMIEADTLCNRIAIIGDGKLRVVASQQHLKDKYGSGYVLQLNLIRSTQEHQDRAMSFVRSRLHIDATLDNKQAKTLHIHLPRDINLNNVFAALYSRERSTEGCINQFLLSQSSLEDVFLALG